MQLKWNAQLFHHYSFINLTEYLHNFAEKEMIQDAEYKY